MVFRRKRVAEPVMPAPMWRSDFDAAAASLRSRPRPSWIDDRLDDLERALLAAQTDADRMGASIDRLDPERASSELKQALRNQQRQLPTGSDGADDKRVAVLRERYATVNDLMNRRRDTQRVIADSIADLEMLAVQAERDEFGLTGSTHALDEHLERLDVDLRALRLARDELGAVDPGTSPS